MKEMTNIELVEQLKKIANNYQTLYVNGGIGYRLTPSGKSRALGNPKNRKNLIRKAKINKATDTTWAFDCNNLILAVANGWCGDYNKTYGGANWDNPKWYTTEELLNKGSNISSNFNEIEIGEMVWIQGHVGVYVGNGQVIECTPNWKYCVQFTNLGNVPQYKKGNYRVWKKHCRLHMIKYEQSSVTQPTKKSNEEIAREVIKGLWGNGQDRKKRLANAGYDYSTIQKLVNEMMKGK